MGERIDLSKLGDAYVRSLMGFSYLPGLNLSATTSKPFGLREVLRYGKSLRDEWLHNFHIIPGAVNSFVEVATSREWMVTGTPIAVGRAVERLNKSYFIDDYGIVHEGFEPVMARLAMDWLTVGRCALHSTILRNSRGPIEYIDTTNLFPKTLDSSELVPTSVGWEYITPIGDRVMPQPEVIFSDCITFGRTGAFLGKVAYLVPAAQLAWYIHEHITAKLDGRKIRDIFLVSNDEMVTALEEALNSAMALAMGENPEKFGLPVVAVNRIGTNEPVSSTFSRMGLSELSDALDLEEFYFRLANETSSVLGLSMRYFWSDSRGANRATEQIAQERQAVQGPSFFVRSIERMINNSSFLSSARQKVRFLFAEEVDSASAKRKAETLKTLAEGLSIIKDVVSPKLVPKQNGSVTFSPTGERIETPPVEYMEVPRANSDVLPPEAIIAFLERQGLLSTDLTLPDLITKEQDGLRSVSDTEIELARGDIIMNGDGQVIERRPWMMAVRSGG